jgi:hypothetical protein
MAETMATMVTHDSHTLKRVVMVGMFFHMPLESNWIVDWPIRCALLINASSVDHCLLWIEIRVDEVSVFFLSWIYSHKGHWFKWII